MASATRPEIGWLGVATPGVCLRSAACRLGRSGRKVFVALRAPFVCPDCGHGLAAPLQQTEYLAAPQSGRPVAMACLGLMLLGGVLLADASQDGGGIAARLPPSILPHSLSWLGSVGARLGLAVPPARPAASRRGRNATLQAQAGARPQDAMRVAMQMPGEGGEAALIAWRQ